MSICQERKAEIGVEARLGLLHKRLGNQIYAMIYAISYTLWSSYPLTLTLALLILNSH